MREIKAKKIERCLIQLPHIKPLFIYCAAASIATRTFMQKTHEFKSEYYSKLLPAM